MNQIDRLAWLVEDIIVVLACTKYHLIWGGVEQGLGGLGLERAL
jgi:hypothetical protein